MHYAVFAILSVTWLHVCDDPLHVSEILTGCLWAFGASVYFWARGQI
jgi:hypothetical protein